MMTITFSNEPPEIDGTYIAVNSYKYSYTTDNWLESDEAFQIIEIRIDDQKVRICDQTFVIEKLKIKMYKNEGMVDFELKLSDSNGKWSFAIFTYFEEDKTGKKKSAAILCYEFGF